MTRSISLARPMTGSSLPWRASSVRSRPKLSRAGVLDLPLLAPCARRRRCRRRRSSLVRHVVPQQVQDFLADVFELQAQVHQHLGGDALLLAEQAEQQVLGADVVVVEVAGLLDRVLDDLLGPRRLRQLAHGDHVRAGLDDLLDLQADLAQVDVEVLQHVGGDAGAFLDQAEQDVLGADVLVVEALGLLVGQLHHLASPVGESFVHLRTSPACRVPPPVATGGRVVNGPQELERASRSTVRGNAGPLHSILCTARSGGQRRPARNGTGGEGPRERATARGSRQCGKGASECKVVGF